jgi:hypothetical protein
MKNAEAALLIAILLAAFGFASQLELPSAPTQGGSWGETHERALQTQRSPEPPSPEQPRILSQGWVGCWFGTIFGENLTSLVLTGNYRLGPWEIEQYKICLSSSGSVSVSTTEHSSQTITYQKAVARLLSRGPNEIRIWSDLEFTGPNQPFRVEQISILTARRSGSQMVVSATANATVDSRPAYRLSWVAKFNRE